MSWQHIRDQQPAIQTFIFERFLARVNAAARENRINPPECFILASFQINGYGTQINLAEARRLILHAARWGHQVSQACAYRLCQATDGSYVADEQVVTYLENRALDGSRAALQDLDRIAPEKAPRIKWILRMGSAGVGAPFFGSELINGYSHGQWINTFNNTVVLVQVLQRLNKIAEYKVNQRGDRILHMAAGCGKRDAVEALLNSFSALNVNQLNDQGETPLLSACRSGHKDVVEVLLQRGADASLVLASNESPLHWLVSFDDEDIEDVGSALVEKGGNIRLMATKYVTYSSFPSSIDFDHQPPGTPITWAVHHDRPAIVRFLLGAADTAAVCIDKLENQPSPMEWAAHYHHTECLKLMIEAMKQAKLGFTYLHFLQSATHSSDVLSMILRNGVKYKDRLKECMDYLLEETHGATFSTGIGGFGHTLLYFAVSEAHDAIVEYLLSPETTRLLAAGRERLAQKTGSSKMPVPRYGVYSPQHINMPCGDEQRTPLLECVRWNRYHLFELLLCNGADVQMRSRDPFDSTKMDWSALHVFAQAGHDIDVTLAERIVQAGAPVDGRLGDSLDSETPLLVALKNNAFNLANLLLRHNANVNARSESSGLLTLEYPTTILGHIVASAARHSIPRLRYLLYDCPAADQVEVIVESERSLTALHRVAWAYKGVFNRSPDGKSAQALNRKEYDFANNRDIAYELLQRFGDALHLNAKTADTCRTAMHLAVDAINVEVVRLLLDHGASISIPDSMGDTPADLALNAVRHEGIQCDGPCAQSPLRGVRWHCDVCADHDVCGACRSATHESSEHVFKEITLSQTMKRFMEGTSHSTMQDHEMVALDTIIDLLQARQRRDASHQALEEVSIGGLSLET
jgi:ankyrin repeat protein